MRASSTIVKHRVNKHEVINYETDRAHIYIRRQEISISLIYFIKRGGKSIDLISISVGRAMILVTVGRESNHNIR